MSHGDPISARYRRVRHVSLPPRAVTYRTVLQHAHRYLCVTETQNHAAGLGRHVVGVVSEVILEVGVSRQNEHVAEFQRVWAVGGWLLSSCMKKEQKMQVLLRTII